MTRFVAIDIRSDDTWAMRFIPTLLIFLVLAFFPGAGMALERHDGLQLQQDLDQQPIELEIAQSNGMSLSQAIQTIRRRTGGKVISAETRVQGGREVHYIKVLKDGKVKTHKVNGRRV